VQAEKPSCRFKISFLVEQGIAVLFEERIFMPSYLSCSGDLSTTVEGVPVCTGSWVMVEDIGFFPSITLEEADSLFSAALLVWALAWVFSQVLSFLVRK